MEESINSFWKLKQCLKNGYKQFVSTNDVEHFAVDCKQDGRLEDYTKHNEVVGARYENRVGWVKY